MPQQCQIVRESLAEAESGINEQLLGRKTGSAAGRHALIQKGAHFGHHVGVYGCLLHGARLPLHVHQAHRTAARARRRQRPGGTQRTHIVDQPGAGGGGGGHDLRLTGVDREDGAGRRTQAADDGHHTRKLRLHAHPFSPRAR